MSNDLRSDKPWAVASCASALVSRGLRVRALVSPLRSHMQTPPLSGTTATAIVTEGGGRLDALRPPLGLYTNGDWWRQALFTPNLGVLKEGTGRSVSPALAAPPRRTAVVFVVLLPGEIASPLSGFDQTSAMEGRAPASDNAARKTEPRIGEGSCATI